MAVYQSPVGLSAAPVANQLSELLTFKEHLCKPICANGNQPNASVTYTYNTPILNGTTLFIPIVANIQFVPQGGCNQSPVGFVERFMVAFQGVTSMPTAINITSLGLVQNLSKFKCNKAYEYVINDSITIALTLPAAG